MGLGIHVYEYYDTRTRFVNMWVVEILVYVIRVYPFAICYPRIFICNIHFLPVANFIHEYPRVRIFLTSLLYIYMY